MDTPSEVREMHSLLIRAALEVDATRGYWAHADGTRQVTPKEAFEGFWFGSRSLKRVSELLANMRLRYDAFPASLATLHRWSDMTPDTRGVICHWHLMLADPLYRKFTGEFLVQRRDRGTNEVHFDLVVTWLTRVTAGRWAMSTLQQIAGRLLSASKSAGLVVKIRDPRVITLPRVEDDALTYLLYLLRGVEFDGTLLDNPYLASVGLAGAPLHDRLRSLADLSFARQQDLVEFSWRYTDLIAWGEGSVFAPGVSR